MAEQRMIEEILNEGKAKVEAVMAEAKEKADRILSDAKEKADAITAEGNEKAEAVSKDVAARYESQADTNVKQAFLKARQDMIKDCLEKAKGKVLDMDDEKYFGILTTLLKKNLQKKDGVLYFSEKDLKRLTPAFKENAVSLAKAAGGNLDISDEPRNIDGGFVLAYGGIEENCSMSAIFEENEEKLTDKVRGLLFA